MVYTTAVRTRVCHIVGICVYRVLYRIYNTRTHVLCPFFFFSFVFSWQAFGAEIPPYVYFAMAVLIGVPIVGFIAFEMWKTLGENRRIRRARKKMEAIEEVIFFFQVLSAY